MENKEHSVSEQTQSDKKKLLLTRRNALQTASVFGLGAMGFDTDRLTAAINTPGSQTYDTPEDPSKSLGYPAGNDQGYGKRSQYAEGNRKLKKGNIYSARTLTPLQHSLGIITPSSLHFERHHAGIPTINPNKHYLLVHGLVKKNKIYKMSDLMRYPSISSIHFIECSGNGRDLWKTSKTNLTVQDTHGLMSNSEWTGVPLKILLQDIQLKSGAKWIIAEGADASRLARSIPIEKCLDDAILAYGQNGEAIRPEQGFPLRLILPGWEGNTNIKWLRRLHITDRPYMTQQETSKYTDLLPSGKASQFSFQMNVNSVITYPSGQMKLTTTGYHEITGLAWSGVGKVHHVDISTNGGKSWNAAVIQKPILPKCHTRFRYSWNWNGQPCIIQSRCVDEHGNIQPTLKQLISSKGLQHTYHMNAIHSWAVLKSGEIENLYN